MVFFVGAGPGDVDLITVKGRRLLEEADVIIYAGSLVWDKHLEFCKSGSRHYNSASMTLEECVEIMKEAEQAGQMVVRLHTGDPTLFGAILEQMDLLDQEEITYEVIPGVSSFTASCAALKRQFTVPEISQTVIVTRMAGRTPVPESEDLESLAKHQCSMAIFLSIQNIQEVVDKLIRGYGSEDIPIVVVHKATWPQQKIIQGTLKDISEKVTQEEIKSSAMILVGQFIEGEFARSKLYDPSFTHQFRKKTS